MRPTPCFRRGRRAVAAACVAALSLLPALAATAHGAVGDTLLVSQLGGVGAGDDSFAPSSSADGRFVAFVSRADDLSLEDDDGVLNVYRRDMLTGAVTLVSRATGAAGPGADDDATNPAISADGRRVVFQSAAENLSAADGAGTIDVYVRDIAAATTAFMSFQVSGPADADCINPAISGDGEVIAFESTATNLDGADVIAGPPVDSDVFIRHVDDGPLSTASLNNDGEPGNGHSHRPSLSYSGLHVAFDSTATNFSEHGFPGYSNVFVRRNDVLTFVVANDPRTPGTKRGDSFNPSISGDGRFVAFESQSPDLVLDDLNNVTDVFVRDLERLLPKLVSRTDGPSLGFGDRASSGPSISRSGRFVAFTSTATNFSAADADPIPDVFVRDVELDTTTLASRGVSGGGSVDASISADARFVAYQSNDPRLSDVDLDGGVIDVFRFEQLPFIPPVTPPPGPAGLVSGGW